MNNALAYLWRHPRRTGFIALNLIVLAAFMAWGIYTANAADIGVGALPAIMLGYTGMAMLAIVWISAWVAWAWFVASRHMHRNQ